MSRSIKSYYKNRSLNLCVSCGKPMEQERIGKIRCVSCAKKQSRNAIARKARFATRSGMCVYCGRSKVSPSSRIGCVRCLAVKRENQIQYKARCLKNGLCPDCGVKLNDMELATGQKKCGVCYAKWVERHTKA